MEDLALRFGVEVKFGSTAVIRIFRSNHKFPVFAFVRRQLGLGIGGGHNNFAVN
jgi:hypothetical protein